MKITLYISPQLYYSLLDYAKNIKPSKAQWKSEVNAKYYMKGV